VFDETYVHWVENNTDETRVILFADVERPLKTGFMRAINHRFGAFMGHMTASPNSDAGAEKTGLINRLYAISQRNRARSRAFKKRAPTLFRTFKYSAIVVALWVIFLAPWPVLR
jgi:beta-hydroxylase